MKKSLMLQRLADKMYLTLSEAIVFNLSFESVTQYNLCRIVDRGDKEEDQTSSKLRTHVLYLETST